MARAWLLLSLALAAAAALAGGGACATLGSPAGGNAALPSARMGPFRALTKTEEPDTPSFVFESPTMQFREPSALAVDPAAKGSMNVYLYATATLATDAGTADVIVRTRADDGRSFYGTAFDTPNVPPVVLAASQAWEGPSVGGPSALRVGSEFYLYYAAAGGIGLARSPDGLTFTKEPGPVLAPDPAATWEKTTPFAPSVAVLPDGTFDMMYSAGDSIGEATSHDGITFARQDGDPATPELDPVLSPLRGVALPPAPTDASADGSEDASADGAPSAVTGPFDTGKVSDPCVVPQIDPTGRLVVRVLYTGSSPELPDGGAGASAIGLAARYGTSGHLDRQPLPVFSVDMHEAAPSYFAWSAGEMLYVQAMRPKQLFSSGYESIVAGVAPATITLAAPVSYAASP